MLEDDNVTSLDSAKRKRELPRKNWIEKFLVSIEGMIGEYVRAGLAGPKAEIAELRAKVERLEALTRHLDKPLHEVER
jgi:hypothetical protein